jgi:hypothetical protein
MFLKYVDAYLPDCMASKSRRLQYVCLCLLFIQDKQQHQIFIENMAALRVTITPYNSQNYKVEVIVTLRNKSVYTCIWQLDLDLGLKNCRSTSTSLLHVWLQYILT